MAVPCRGRYCPCTCQAALTAERSRAAPKGHFLPKEEEPMLESWGLPQGSSGTGGPQPLKFLRAKGIRPVAFLEEVSSGR